MNVLRLALVLAVLSSATRGEEQAPPAHPVSSVTDITGRVHRLADDKRASVVVWIYVGVDCPIANFYQPALRKLAQDFAVKGVAFFQVHGDPDVTAQQAEIHAQEYEIVSPVILDPEQKLARLHRPRVTPEAIVFARDGNVAYRGRIDDTYTDYGKRRPEPTTHDLRDALEAVLAGQEVAVPVTEPVGCHILIEE